MKHFVLLITVLFGIASFSFSTAVYSEIGKELNKATKNQEKAWTNFGTKKGATAEMESVQQGGEAVIVKGSEKVVQDMKQ